LIDDLSTRDINNDGSWIEHRDLLGTNEPVGIGKKWGRDHQDVTAAQRRVQLIRTNDTVYERRNRLIETTPHARHVHAECVGATRDFLADRTKTEDRHSSPLKAPRPRIARQFILNPTTVALSIEH